MRDVSKNVPCLSFDVHLCVFLKMKLLDVYIAA